MTRRTSMLLGASAAALLLASLSSGAFAQTGGATARDNAGPNVGEVVITAQRRAERQVDVPISITALSSQQLAVANVQNLGDIQKVTPSLRFDNQIGFFQPSIRGIGTGVTTSGGGANVGTYIDGFYSPNPLAADFQLTKVSSIQVLKGPQGTLFGRNTTGGAILVTTADPSTTPEFDAKATYGSFSAQRYQGYGTFGITDKIAVDLEGIYSRGDGFVTNIVDGNNHVGAYKNWTIRSGIKVQFTDRISALFRYTHSELDDPTGQMLNSNTDSTIDPTTGKPWGVQTFTKNPLTGLPAPYTTDPDQIAADTPRFIRTHTNIAQLTVRADLGFANLTSYSQYRTEDTDQSEDLDQTGVGTFQLGLPVYDKTFSQEFLLTSKKDSKLQWTAGAFALNTQDTWLTFIDKSPFFPPGRNRLGGSGTTTASYAGFVDATYPLTSQLFLTAGVRYSHDIVDHAFYNTFFTLQRNYVPSIESDKATPRIVLRYKPTDQSSVYASYTQGYKAAILDVGGSCQNGPQFKCNPVAPEDIDAYEVGYKFANHVISFETSGFYYDYKNLQVSEFLGNAQATIVNAARSKIYGIDAQLNYHVNDHFQFNVGAAWIHARYDTFGGSTVNGVVVGAPIYASCPLDLTTLPAKYTGACGSGAVRTTTFDYVNTDTTLHDVHMQRSPDYTANVGARYTTGMTSTGEYSLSGNLYYTSEFFFSPSGTQFLQPSYTTLALRGEWQDPSHRYSVAVYGDNVTDERYRTQVQYNSDGIGASWSEPANWGIELATKF